MIVEAEQVWTADQTVLGAGKEEGGGDQETDKNTERQRCYIRIQKYKYR